MPEFEIAVLGTPFSSRCFTSTTPLPQAHTGRYGSKLVCEQPDRIMLEVPMKGRNRAELFTETETPQGAGVRYVRTYEAPNAYWAQKTAESEYCTSRRAAEKAYKDQLAAAEGIRRAIIAEHQRLQKEALLQERLDRHKSALALRLLAR